MRSPFQNFQDFPVFHSLSTEIDLLQHHSMTGFAECCTCMGDVILSCAKAATEVAEISWSSASSQAPTAAASNPFPSPAGKELNLERQEDWKYFEVLL